MIDIAVVSLQPALRAGIRALLSEDPGLAVTAAASLPDLPENGGGWRVIVTTEAPLDPFQGSGAGSLLAVNEFGRQAGAAMLLVSDDAVDAQRLAGLGLPAWGVISPEAPAESLQAAVRALAEGLVVLSPEMLENLLPGGGPESVLEGGGAVLPDEQLPPDRLTARETEVLLLLAQGLTNKGIAYQLHISEHTVKFHVSSIYAKLGASNRTEAVRKGARSGLVPL